MKHPVHIREEIYFERDPWQILLHFERNNLWQNFPNFSKYISCMSSFKIDINFECEIQCKRERERVRRGREKEIESWKIEKVGLTMLRFVGAVWSKGYFLSIQEKSSSGKINCSSPLAFLVGNLVGTFAKDSQKILFFFFFSSPPFPFDVRI